MITFIYFLFYFGYIFLYTLVGKLFLFVLCFSAVLHPLLTYIYRAFDCNKNAREKDVIAVLFLS